MIERAFLEALLLHFIQHDAERPVQLLHAVAVEPVCALAAEPVSHLHHRCGAGLRLRHVKEERLVLAPANEISRRLGVALREFFAIRRRLDHFRASHQRKRRPDVGLLRLHHVLAVGDAEEFIEALIGGQERRLVTEMPLAVAGCRVAATPQDFCDGDLVRVQTPGGNGLQHRAADVADVEVHALCV